jgi:Lrp/AsnC family leucine-responsive transcriptional regulator
VKVRATDTEELGRMLRNDFSMMPSVRSTRTTIVLGTLKESARIPIPDENQIAIA